MTSAVDYVCLVGEDNWIGSLRPGEYVIFNEHNGSRRIVARKKATSADWNLEVDGEHLAELCRFECDGRHPVSGTEAFLEIESLERPGKYRVLLERLTDHIDP